jgi:2'-5' RNA ligase
MEPPARRRRLFLALWPTPELREQLASRIGGWLGDQAPRAQRPDQWHTTLVFIGWVDAARVSLIDELAEGISCAPFVLSFDTLDHWRKPRVACLTASVIPAPLLSLVAGLEAALDAAGIDFDRRPYRPHLTLARKVVRLEHTGPIPTLAWAVHDFTLVESISTRAGSRYEPLGCYSCRS